jgi:hypothetical protein
MPDLNKATQIRGWLLAEGARQRRRPLEVLPRGRVGGRDEADRKARHDRVDARLEQRDPDRHGNDEGDLAAARGRVAQHHQQAEQGDCDE